MRRIRWNNKGGLTLRLVLALASLLLTAIIIAEVFTSAKGEILNILARLFGIL